MLVSCALFLQAILSPAALHCPGAKNQKDLLIVWKISWLQLPSMMNKKTWVTHLQHLFFLCLFCSHTYGIEHRHATTTWTGVPLTMELFFKIALVSLEFVTGQSWNRATLFSSYGFRDLLHVEIVSDSIWYKRRFTRSLLYCISYSYMTSCLHIKYIYLRF